MTKICKKCSTEKPLSEFSASKANKDGKQRLCKSCSSIENAGWNAKNRDKRARYDANRYRIPGAKEHRVKQHAEHRTNVEFRARSLVIAAKRRIPENFSVSFDHVMQSIERGKCSVTGMQFDLRPYEKQRSGKRCNPYAPSLDRIDSRLGYTNENTRVVIWQYNHMKGELSDSELLQICKQYIERMHA